VRLIEDGVPQSTRCAVRNCVAASEASRSVSTGRGVALRNSQWRSAEWYARLGVLHAFTQNDIALNETSTAGYNLLKAEVSYTHTFAKVDGGLRDITFGVTGDNLLDEQVRNHISFKKAEVLQPGRGVRLFTSMRF